MQAALRRVLGCCWLPAALALGAATRQQAHPHVWITATSELIYAPDGSITGVRHAWTFDDMFSTYALQGIETKTKGVYSREELAPLAQTNVESLKEFGFFTFAKADGKKQKFQEPVDYFLEYKDALLTLHFTLPLKTPVKPKQLVLEVFDPDVLHRLQVCRQGPGQAGRRARRLPDASSSGRTTAPPAPRSSASRISPSGGNSNFGVMFANKITVDCP